ncbi:hypothetical protein [Shewanella xiamenensis]|uniref:hypothetical protein n=1 Tax=Shewanella xiamenensis TaxID=332186 RepID=UPI002E7AD670|nr:hypothetical protein [Shewanella xiamenensis]MEE1982754.1 hypothetical protein [Shewanella xiamenensis]
MSIMNKNEIFIVQESSVTFKKLINDASIEVASTLNDKSVVILPSHGHDDLYYAGTLDTLDYLNDNEVNTDVYASDEEYKEIALHGADIWLGSFLISSVAVPIFCNVISSYIYDKLKAKKDDNIALKFMVENKEGKTTAVEFNGKVEHLSKAIDAVKGLSDES